MAAGADPSPNVQGQHGGTVAGGSTATDIVVGADTFLDTVGNAAGVDDFTNKGKTTAGAKVTVADLLARKGLNR